MKNTALGVGSRNKYNTQLCLVLYLSLDPIPHAVFPYITRNGALTNIRRMLKVHIHLTTDNYTIMSYMWKVVKETNLYLLWIIVR